MEKVPVPAPVTSGGASSAAASASRAAFRRAAGRHLAVDADAVVVVQGDQLVQLPGAGQRAGFVADAFHQAAIAQEDIGVVVDDAVVGLVEFGRQQLFGQRHAHGVGDALAEWAGGGFHAGRQAVLGVAGSLAVQLAEVFQLLQRQVVACEVQQGVDQHRRVAVAEHEAVAVGPQRVAGVVLEVAAPQRDGHVGHAHGRARVARIGLLDGVHREGADGVGHEGGIRHGTASGVGYAEPSILSTDPT